MPFLIFEQLTLLNDLVKPNIGCFFLLESVVDDCVAFPGICNNGTCVNRVDGFDCLCPPGFVYDFAVGACIGMSTYTS